MSGWGKVLWSKMSSRYCMAIRVISAKRIRSGRFSSLTKLVRLIDPRLQGSLSRRGTSPQGLVPVSLPNQGVGLDRSAVSIK